MGASKFYFIKPDDAGWGAKLGYEIDAAHECGLPGVRCPVCQATWGMVGLQYPTVLCGSLEPIRNQLKPQPVPLEEFCTLAATVHSILGDERPLAPGAAFGPIRGHGHGPFGDFAWLNPWTALIRKEAFLTLRLRGLALRGAETNLQFRKRDAPTLIEIEAWPIAKLHPSCLPDPPPERCSACGRLGLSAPKRIVVASDSLDERVPIQRLIELPTFLLVNEKLATAIQDLELRDVRLLKTEVA